MALTTKGISHQIVSAISTYKNDGLGTINDCKVVINHLIRKYSEPLEKEGNQKFYRSSELRDKDKVIKEHLIPVKEIMHHLLEECDISDKRFFSEYVDTFLTKSLVLILITKEEDLLLSGNGYQQKMPAEYSDPNNELCGDVWSRYKCAGIYGNIIKA